MSAAHDLQKIVDRAGAQAGARFDALQYRRHPEWCPQPTITPQQGGAELAKIAAEAMRNFVDAYVGAVNYVAIQLFGNPTQRAAAQRIIDQGKRS